MNVHTKWDDQRQNQPVSAQSRICCQLSYDSHSFSEMEDAEIVEKV
jgi:hypothetical protein